MHFKDVNRRDDPLHRPGWQRHHIFPNELRGLPQIADFINTVLPNLDFEDFDYNGILLPGCTQVAGSSGLPLHNGPHPRYNDWVAGSIDAIATAWRSLPERRDVFAANAVRALHRRLRENLARPRAASIELDDLAIFLPYPERDRHFAMADRISAKL